MSYSFYFLCWVVVTTSAADPSDFPIIQKLFKPIVPQHPTWTTATPFCKWLGIICFPNTETVQKIDLTWDHKDETKQGYRFTGPFDFKGLPPKVVEVILFQCAFNSTLDLSSLPKTVQIINVQ
eukprot:PhF_6_TR40203/c0_g1_i1/m.59689